MKYIGELKISDTGSYLSSIQHVIRDADITPDPDVLALINNMTAQYNTAHPGHPVDELIGYTADNLMLDNDMKWWSADEYPWSGNDTAGQWICDAMQWKASQLFGSCDLSIESGGGVRADIPAGPVTYMQIYETYPWNDDYFDRVNMTGQEIVNYLKLNSMDAGFSSALDVTAFDGNPTTVLFNGQPIDPNHTYTVAISNYMYTNPPTGWTWSDTNPLTSTYLCRDGIVDYMRQFTAGNPYHVGGDRYHLNTEFSGGYRAVVTMMNDNDTKPVYEYAFIRLLSATPETMAHLGSNQVPASLVNADGTINVANRLSEQEMYRSYYGFKTGALKPGDIIETWGKGSAYGGNPEFVDQEGVYADGVEFKVVGHDTGLAKPVFMSSIGAFWNDNYKNHYVQFIGKKTAASTVIDQNGMSISINDVTGYVAKTLPGNVGDLLLISGVTTSESYGLRFRCDNAAVTTAGFPPVTGPSSHVNPVAAGTTSSALSLNASASVGSSVFSLTPTADSYVSSGKATSNYGTSTTLYLQSSSTSTYGNERAWLKFDISNLPAGATITSATLQLYDWGAAGAALPTEVRGGSDDTWTETGINWNNQPAFGAALATQTLAANTYNLWYNWDVTTFAQSKFSGNKLVSLVVKPVTEGAPDATAPSYKFDSKEYSSTKPVLQVTTTGGSATITQVEYFYRFSSDNTTWGAWTSAGAATTAPYTLSFAYPNGQGYYEFYSRATNSNNNVEPAPAADEAATHYTNTPAYYPTVSLANLYQKFDGTAKAISVTTLPAGAAVGVTYNGSSAAPINAGTYALVATATSNGNVATTTGMLTIAPTSSATITIGNLNQGYDGSAKSVNVTTNPPNLVTTVTYSGSSNPPLNAGAYNVIATINDPNALQTSSNAVLNIAAASAGITFSNLSFTYDGTAKNVTVTTTPPTDAGSYAVVATISDPNYQGTASGTLTISAGTGAAAVPALGPWSLLAAATLLVGVSLQRRSQKS